MVSMFILFYVSCLKELIDLDDNIVTIKDMVTHEYLSSKPHLVEKIREFGMKWLDQIICDFVQEKEHFLNSTSLILICHCKSAASSK